MSYNEWLDIDVLEDYLDGKLDAKTMHKVERISLEDPFVAQALAGLTESKKRKQSLSLLQKQLQERIAQKPVEKKLWTITSQRLSIAAAAAVLFITVSLFFFMRENSRQKEEQIASNKPKKVEVTIAPETAAVAMKADTTSNEKRVETELDKAIANAKTNSYAKNNKKLKEKPLQDNVPLQAMPISSSPSALQEISLQNNAEKEKNAIVESNKKSQEQKMASASASKAAGVIINVKPISQTINGTVYSKKDGLPLPSASVKIAGTNIGTATDINGEFSLSIDSLKNQKLLVYYIGFKTKEINIKVNEKLKIELEDAKYELIVDEISTSKIKKSKYVITSKPVIDWNDYDEYLKKNVKKELVNNLTSTAPTVELKFTINKNGFPTNIKIIKSGGKVYDKEAIRLLKNGCKWTYYSGNKNVGELEIDFDFLEENK